MPGKKRNLEKASSRDNKNNPHKEVDRDGNGDCLFRAVLDHFLPEATNEQLRILAIVLRRLVAKEERRLTSDTEIKKYKEKLSTRAADLQAKRDPEAISLILKLTDPNLNRNELLESADRIELEGEYAEDPEIVILTHLLNANILVTPTNYSGNVCEIVDIEKCNRESFLFYDDNLVDIIKIKAKGHRHYTALRDADHQTFTVEQEKNKIKVLTLLLDNLHYLQQNEIQQVAEVLLKAMDVANININLLLQPKPKRIRLSNNRSDTNDNTNDSATPTVLQEDKTQQKTPQEKASFFNCIAQYCIVQ